MPNRAKLLRAFDIFGVLIALGVVLAWMYGLQVRNWYRARNLKRDHPALSLLPRLRPDSSVTRDKTILLTEFGYQLAVPWPQVEGHKTSDALAVYIFPGGRGLTFWNPGEITGTVATVRGAMKESNRQFTTFLGAKTEYELLNEELSVTPDQLSPVMSKSESFRRELLLNMKRVELQRNPSAIYSLSANGMRGFQLGDPAKDRLVEIRTFDAQDQEFRMLFAVERGSNVKLEQGEINEVLESVRPASTTQIPAPATPPSR